MGSASGCHREKPAYNRGIQTSPIRQIPTPPRPSTPKPGKFARQSDVHRYESIWSERQRVSDRFGSIKGKPLAVVLALLFVQVVDEVPSGDD